MHGTHSPRCSHAAVDETQWWPGRHPTWLWQRRVTAAGARRHKHRQRGAQHREVRTQLHHLLRAQGPLAASTYISQNSCYEFLFVYIWFRLYHYFRSIRNRIISCRTGFDLAKGTRRILRLSRAPRQAGDACSKRHGFFAPFLALNPNRVRRASQHRIGERHNAGLITNAKWQAGRAPQASTTLGRDFPAAAP